MIQSVNQLIQRDLDRLKNELQAFDHDRLWHTSGAVNNSAGNLVLHICGNLRHFIGTVLGQTDYVRNRESEFEAKDISVSELVKEIEKAKSDVENTLMRLHNDALREPYPLEVFGYTMSKGYFLIHLQGHLNYHLGQINYLRRLS